MEQIRISKIENDLFKIVNLSDNRYTYINKQEIENVSINSLIKVIEDIELRVKYFSQIKSVLSEIQT